MRRQADTATDHVQGRVIDRTSRGNPVLQASQDAPSAGAQNAGALKVTCECLGQSVFFVGEEDVAQVAPVSAFGCNQEPRAGIVLCPSAVINAALDHGLVGLGNVEAGDGR